MATTLPLQSYFKVNKRLRTVDKNKFEHTLNKTKSFIDVFKRQQLNEKYMPLFHPFYFKVSTSYLLSDRTTIYFIFSSFTSTFASESIIFYKFLELHLTLSQKILFVEFSFVNGLTQSPRPFNRQKPLSTLKNF